MFVCVCVCVYVHMWCVVGARMMVGSKAREAHPSLRLEMQLPQRAQQQQQSCEMLLCSSCHQGRKKRTETRWPHPPTIASPVSLMMYAHGTNDDDDYDEFLGVMPPSLHHIEKEKQRTFMPFSCALFSHVRATMSSTCAIVCMCEGEETQPHADINSCFPSIYLIFTITTHVQAHILHPLSFSSFCVFVARAH